MVELAIEKYSVPTLIFIIICYTVAKDFGVFKKLNGTPTRVYQQINDLWLWHSKEDERGIKVWYSRKELEQAVVKVVDIQEKLVDMNKDLSHSQKDIERIIAEIKADISAIRNSISAINRV